MVVFTLRVKLRVHSPRYTSIPELAYDVVLTARVSIGVRGTVYSDISETTS